MRVLAVSSYPVLGGAELSMATFVEHRPSGCDVELLLVGDGPLGAHLAARGLPVRVAQGFEGRPGAGDFVRFTRRLRRVLVAHRPDVVWATGMKGALLALGACRMQGVPLVWHKVDFSWDRKVAMPLAAGVNGVITVSNAVAVALGPLRRVRLLGVVGPPLRLPDSLQTRPHVDDPAVGTCGRLVPYKGHHHIIEAAALLRREFPTLRIVLAGAPVAEFPDYPSELRHLADRLGVAESLEMPGFVQDVGPLLERLSVYVNATHLDPAGFGLEGLSGAMLEASWAGVPVVATRGGGTEEGVRDGLTGTLVDDPDPATLASAIALYLRDHELARRAGAAGRAFTRERFSPADGARRVFELLEGVA